MRPSDLTTDDLGLLTVAEAARAVGVSPATIRKWVARHGLRLVHVEGRRLLVERDVLDCEAARRRDGRGRRRAAIAP